MGIYKLMYTQQSYSVHTSKMYNDAPNKRSVSANTNMYVRYQPALLNRYLGGSLLSGYVNEKMG